MAEADNVIQKQTATDRDVTYTAMMLAARFSILRRAKRVKKLQKLQNAMIKTNTQKRGAGRPEGRVDLDQIPENAWRNHFR